ncbi:MAG: helix-turn-helix transcriptional regulator [Thermoanaerobaculia bacterium]
MRRNETPDERALCLYILRSLRGWTQQELAKALGTTAGALSEYETGKRYTPERIVRRTAEIMGISVSTVVEIETALRDLRSALQNAPLPKGNLRDSLAEELYRGFEELARKAVETVLASSQAWMSSAESARDLVPADVLWAELERCGREERRLVVEEGVEYQTWGLCKLLCQKSLETTDGGGAALELAELALHVAERVAGDKDSRVFIQAFAWAHLGQARRRLGDRPGAEEALARFREFWQSEAPPRTLPLDDGQVAELKALVSGEIGSLH